MELIHVGNFSLSKFRRKAGKVYISHDRLSDKGFFKQDRLSDPRSLNRPRQKDKNRLIDQDKKIRIA